MVSSVLGDIRAFAFLLLGFGFAVADLWHFHSITAETDLAILFGVFAGTGITVAHSAGANAAGGTIPPNPPPPLK